MVAHRFFHPLSGFASALALALAFTSAPAQTVLPALLVTPNPAPAGKNFTLTLNGLAAPCGVSYTRQSATVNGGRIDLQFTMTTGITIYPLPVEPDGGIGDIMPVPEPVCPADDQVRGSNLLPNGPMFAMSPLKAGSYEVWATNIPACAYATQPCDMALQPMAAGKLEVTEQGAISYHISPATAEAGQDFELSLLSYDFNCGTTFDNLSVGVGEGVITLSFLDHEQTGIMCPAVYKPYGPTFKVSGLKVGTYKIKAYRHPDCLPCKMLGVTADAGVLTVKSSVAKKGWYLKQDKAASGKPFDMQLLRDDVGNCQTAFSYQTVTSSEGGIYASFLMETHPERVCIQDMRPYGPAFTMPALKVGIYPIFPIELMACEVAPSPCAVKRVAPVATDTLVVTQTLSLPISKLRAGAPAVSMRGDKGVFSLPAGATGLWQAELMSLDGRVLAHKRLSGGAGTQVEISVGRAPANAVSLLRLTSPAGGQTFMPIVR